MTQDKRLYRYHKKVLKKRLKYAKLEYKEAKRKLKERYINGN